jgi:hypothetical protein
MLGQGMSGFLTDINPGFFPGFFSHSITRDWRFLWGATRSHCLQLDAVVASFEEFGDRAGPAGPAGPASSGFLEDQWLGRWRARAKPSFCPKNTLPETGKNHRNFR